MADARAEDDLILTARWVLPICALPIEEGAVRVRSGRITQVGRADQLLGCGGPPSHRLDLGHAAILPGLVNVHTHLELTLLRGFCEDLDFFSWIRKLTETKRRCFDVTDFRLSARWGALEALRSGITTVGDASDSGVVFDVLLESGLRGIAYQEIFGPDEQRWEESLGGLKDALDSLGARATRRVKVGVSPHAPYTVSAALFRGVTGLVLERGLPMTLHAAESRAEQMLLREGAGPFAGFLRDRGIAWRAPGVSTIQYLADLGVLAAKPLLVHVVDADLEDLERIRSSGASVAHCPKSNAKLCHGIAPLLELVSAGIKTGLGTDSSVSSNNCDLFEEARFAVLLQRTRRDAAAAGIQALDARALLRLATLGGAEALGMASEIGSLEPGKLADVTVVDLSRAHHQPVSDPEASVLFSASAGDVMLTMVDGRVLYQDGIVSTLDEAALREGMGRTAIKLRR